MSISLELHLVEVGGGSPKLGRIVFDRPAESGEDRRHSEMWEVHEPRGNGGPRFNWTRGVKGLTLLLLRSAAAIKQQRNLPELRADETKGGSALHDAVRRRKCSPKNRWIRTMFASGTEITSASDWGDLFWHSLFEFDQKPKWVRLDQEKWRDAKILVYLKGTELEDPAAIEALAARIEGRPGTPASQSVQPRLLEGLPICPVLANAKTTDPNSAWCPYVNGEEAIRSLCNKVDRAKTILNTVIMHPASEPFALTRAMETWVKASCGALRRGAVMRDIMTRAWSGIAARRIQAVKQARESDAEAGTYECRIIKCTFPAFLNFTVLKYADGGEVMFGWLVSRQHTLEQPITLTTDPVAVAIFTAWHSQLFAAGEHPFRRRRRARRARP